MENYNFNNNDANALVDKYWCSCIKDALQTIENAARIGEKSCLIFTTHSIIQKELEQRGFKVDLNYTETCFYVRW